jgi:hypothetical protein
MTLIGLADPVATHANATGTNDMPIKSYRTKSRRGAARLHEQADRDGTDARYAARYGAMGPRNEESRE